ncbi:hypothetical protein ABW21_db0208885 [Orbilia brochopaga]|nr:hypothetical protein ABW21_db0208885 [Drechslerella brochopaga]
MSQACSTAQSLGAGNGSCRLKSCPENVITGHLQQYLHAPSDFFIGRRLYEPQLLQLNERIVVGLLAGEFRFLFLFSGLIYSLCTGVCHTVPLSVVLLQSFGLLRGHALQHVLYKRWSSLVRLLSTTAQELPTVIGSIDSAALEDIKILLYSLASKLATSGPSMDYTRFHFIYPGANQVENAMSLPLDRNSALSILEQSPHKAVFAIISTDCFTRACFECRNSNKTVDLTMEMEEDEHNVGSVLVAPQQILLKVRVEGVQIGFARPRPFIWNRSMNGDMNDSVLLGLNRSFRFILPGGGCLIPQENGRMKFYSEEPPPEDIWPRVPCLIRQMIRMRSPNDTDILETFIY